MLNATFDIRFTLSLKLCYLHYCHFLSMVMWWAKSKRFISASTRSNHTVRSKCYQENANMSQLVHSCHRLCMSILQNRARRYWHLQNICKCLEFVLLHKTIICYTKNYCYPIKNLLLFLNFCVIRGGVQSIQKIWARHHGYSCNHYIMKWLTL